MPNNEILKAIADNPTLLAALKDVLLKQFESPKDFEHETVSDEQLGQALRARIIGINAVEHAFKEIGKYKTPEPRVERINRGI